MSGWQKSGVKYISAVSCFLQKKFYWSLICLEGGLQILAKRGPKTIKIFLHDQLIRSDKKSQRLTYKAIKVDWFWSIAKAEIKS